MGRVAAKYKRRERAVYGQTRQLREAVKDTLVQGLEEVTEDQLYRVSRNPNLTGDMKKSIGGRIRGQVVEVGFNIGRGKKAPHAPGRLQMKGISKAWGHRLDMNVAPALARKTDAKRKQLRRRAQKRILGD